MEDVSMSLPYLEHGWFSHIRGRLLTLDGAIWIENAWVPSIQRENDTSIMEKFAALPGIKKNDLIKANAVRYFLRVITVSDLSDISGHRILKDYLSGSWQANSSLTWPEQPGPPKAAFDLFRRLLKRAFCSRNINCRLDRDILLDRPLGKWLKTERHIDEMVYRNAEHLFVRHDDDKTLFTKYKQDRDGNHWNVTNNNCDYLPKDTHPCTARVTNERIYCEIRYTFRAPVVQPTDDNTQSNDAQGVLDSDEIYLVSDGSLHPITTKAAFEWIIATPDRACWIK
jgi:hypothetical protein